MLNFLKNWTLPVAMLAGALGYFIFANFAFLEPTKPFMSSFVAYLTPALIFAQLLLTFCKVQPHELMPSLWHGWLLLFQLVSASLVAALLIFVHMDGAYKEVFEGAMVCLICPTATAAAVTSLSKCHKVICRFSEDIEQGVPFVALPVFPGDVVPLFPSGTASFPVGFPRPCFLSLGCRACHRDGPDREVSCRKQCSGRSGGADSLGGLSDLRRPVLFG